jgi:hypothetical protein
MNKINFKGAEDTPEIILDKDANKFEISGRSLPEDVIKFYSPVLKWLDEYAINPNPKTVIKIRFDYINSASQRAMLEVFSVLENIQNSGKEVFIEWYYHEDDEEMKDTGIEYSEMLSLPFNFIEFVPE